MPLSLPPVYPITDLRLSGAADHASLVRSLLQGGATWIQIRDKQCSNAQLLRQTAAALELLPPGARLLLNDRVAVARALPVSGIHLGQDDLSLPEARRLLPGAIIGFSTHSLQQAHAAAALPADYLSIGPVFPTATKAGPPPLGLETVRRVRAAVSAPLVAIGGITLASAPQVWEAGADSVAVISDIMAAPDIASRVARYLELWSARHA